MGSIILVVTVALLMVALLVGPASATAGCKEFGQLAASEAQLETGGWLLALAAKRAGTS